MRWCGVRVIDACWVSEHSRCLCEQGRPALTVRPPPNVHLNRPPAPPRPVKAKGTRAGWARGLDVSPNGDRQGMGIHPVLSPTVFQVVVP